MTKNLERLLEDAPLAEVPADLDQSVERLIQSNEKRDIAPAGFRIPVWAALAACVVCALLGYALRPAFEPAQRPEGPVIPTVVYTTSTHKTLPRVLGGDQMDTAAGFFQRKRGEIKTVYPG